jgi:hypothetical protein
LQRAASHAEQLSSRRARISAKERTVPLISSDREVLRRLAREVADIAPLSDQTDTIALWKGLNGLKPVRPMVMIDQIPWHEMDVDGELGLRCTDDFCRGLETRLRRSLYLWKHMRVDAVVEATIDVPKVIRGTGFGVGVVDDQAVDDPSNDVVGHYYHDQLPDEADVGRIRTPEVHLDEKATAESEELAHEIFDGLLTVRMQGALPTYAPWDILVQWRGVEAILYDLVERPAFMHHLVERLTQCQLGLLDQLEQQGLLGWGQGIIHCTGAYADELPAPGFDSAHPRARDLWTFGMSQIFSAVSPAMHEEFEVPYLSRWFERFGLCYYGCCEPLDKKMNMIRKLPNVRKISMSPWVDVETGAREIGRDYVFSRKPSPALLATDTWKPQAVEADLRETLAACKRHGCPVELILKDISTVRYEPQRLWEWAKIAMRLVREG